jgi:acyl-CoA reductase-like NAD-dependent aldehyde dehydrogenase
MDSMFTLCLPFHPVKHLLAIVSMTAVFWLWQGGFSYSGQRCTAVKIVLADEKIAEELKEKVVAGMKKLTVGMPEDNCSITPVVSESSATFIEGLAKDAQEKGATFCQVSYPKVSKP